MLALRYLDEETHDDAVVHYVKKVMIPAWGNTVADDIKRKDVRDWLKAARLQRADEGENQGHHARRLRVRNVRGILFLKSV